ncbi:NAD(P)-binding protein [Neolentinus lepideus HHB14362 ss-1]|uniref:NAD(P)-binding protein n=1 Tax=Neolentinus lepideus HHB14362 ss-1 TaxID=1314782 RepID=A0A165P9B2_9AGAM|nr:NAD(P)-binding protein [Neolentinus lepideus HHB14362 ss-1]
MTTITDEQLLEFANSSKDRVLLITGGANGIGKEVSLLFAQHGAKVVIGDRDVKGGADVVATIHKYGGHAVFRPCNVLEWSDLVSLFEFAIQSYGSIDIVVPMAGVGEAGRPFETVVLANALPQKPNLRTIEINFIAVINTTHLALHYLKKRTPRESHPKSIVLMASMSSWQAIPGAPLYSAAKHGTLGFMRSLSATSEADGIRILSIHPWFVDTALIGTPTKVVLAGLPKTPVTRVAEAVFYAATDTDWKNNGCTLLLPDDGPVLRLEKEELREGVYGTIEARIQFARRSIRGIRLWIGTVRDIYGLIGEKRIFLIAVTAVGGWTLLHKIL